MKDEMILYHNPQSRAQMARFMLEEVGAPYRTVILDFAKQENRRPDFLAINPMGKLPTLVDRGTVVTETGAIIAHLADRFPEAGLAPAPGTPERGAYYRWLLFTAGCFEPALLDQMMQRPEVERRSAVGWGSYGEVINTLKTALTPGPYLLGERFSAADVYLGAELYWAMLFGAPGLKGEALFEDYVARVTDRPAFKRIVEGA